MEKHCSNPADAGTKKERYDRWVDEVCAFLEEVGPKLNCCCSAMQSRPELDRSPEVVFLGYNANEQGEFYVDKKRFADGNPSFYKDDGKNRMTWPIWAKPYHAMKRIGFTRPMEDGNFVFMNAVYFGGSSIKQLQEIPESREAIAQCMRFTEEVITKIFRPKAVVCFSIDSVFEPLARQCDFRDVERVVVHGKNGVKRGTWDDIPVIGVPHPAAHGLTNDDWDAFALFIKQELEKK